MAESKKSLFKKSILRPGRRVSPDAPDAPIEITEDRLKHWADTFAVMTKDHPAGETLSIPMDYLKHADDVTKSVPVPSGKESDRKAAGFVRGFELSSDDHGPFAELTVEVSGADAIEACEKNLLDVSPVIFDSFTDGTGTSWRDCIGQVDLVHHPVDMSQGEFRPVDTLAMSAVRMSAKNGQGVKVYRLASDQFPPNQNDESDQGGGDKSGGEPSRQPNPDAPPNDDDAQLDEAIVMNLEALGVGLPSDFCMDGSKECKQTLLAGLKTAAMSQAKQDEDKSEDEMSGNKSSEREVTKPEVQTMSSQTDDKASTAFRFAERTHKDTIAKRLSSLLESGRCTPKEHEAQSEAVKAIRLSFDQQGEPITSAVENFLAAREAVPEGTFWSAEEKSRRAVRMSSRTTEGHPQTEKGESVSTGELDEESIDDAATFLMTGGRKVAEKKAG